MYPYTAWRLADEKTYHYLRALYVGRAEVAANYLQRMKKDYQLNDSVTKHRLRVTRDADSIPNGLSFIKILMDLTDKAVQLDK